MTAWALGLVSGWLVLHLFGVDRRWPWRVTELGGVGHGITLQGNALKAFDSVGLYERLEKRGFKFSHLRMKTPDGHVIAEMPTPPMGGPDLPGTMGAVRGDIADILAEMVDTEPGTKAERIQRNRRFHFALFDASQNMRLTSLLSQLWDACDRYRALYYPETSALDHVFQSGHEEIIKAAAARDSARLKELLTERRGWAFTEALRVVHSANEKAISEEISAI